ncbi:hypothetical protein GOP47_0011807, partial [Adiantum capillus-veneris]
SRKEKELELELEPDPDLSNDGSDGPRQNSHCQAANSVKEGVDAIRGMVASGTNCQKCELQAEDVETTSRDADIDFVLDDALSSRHDNNDGHAHHKNDDGHASLPVDMSH